VLTIYTLALSTTEFFYFATSCGGRTPLATFVLDLLGTNDEAMAYVSNKYKIHLQLHFD